MKTIASALIATDFSEEATWAVDRAATISKQTGLRGVLAHVLPHSPPPNLHLQAASRAQQGLALVSGELEREGLHFEPRLLSGDITEELAQAGSGFDLVVTGARGAGLLMDFTLGRTSSRLVRRSGRPTLIVRRPAQISYQRVVAALDLSEPSRRAAAFATEIAPTALFHLVNAFEVEFESALRLGGANEDTVQAHRNQAREEAMSAMERFVSSFALPRERVQATATRGYPPTVILDRATQVGADMVVVGKHAAGIVENLLVGSVALRFLERAQCDVLVVPEGPA